MSLSDAYAAAQKLRQSHQDDGHWFDARNGVLAQVRSLRAILSDEEIVVRLVEAGQASAAQVWLCLKAAEILDK